MSASQPPAAAPPSSPWPKRIVTGVVILAILAIGLAIFLPRERQETNPAGAVPAPTGDVVAATSNASASNETAAAPSEAPTPPPPAAQPSALFSQSDAERVVQDLDQTEVVEFQGGISTGVQPLRAAELQDPTFWAIMKGSLASTLAGQGTNIGEAEISTIIADTKTGAEAADKLEQYARNLKTILPRPLMLKLAAILSTAQTPAEALSRTQQTLTEEKTTLSAKGLAKLQSATEAAAGQAPQAAGAPSQ